MSEKPLMHVDSMLRKTHRVPFNPETGELWEERWDDLCYWATARYDNDIREQAEAKYKSLLEATQSWREQPYFCHYEFFGGADGAPRAKRKVMGCHPETWAGMTDEERSQFEMFDVDAWRKTLSKFWGNE